jgi:hypothetical protein
MVEGEAAWVNNKEAEATGSRKCLKVEFLPETATSSGKCAHAERCRSSGKREWESLTA